MAHKGHKLVIKGGHSMEKKHKGKRHKKVTRRRKR